MKSQPHYPSSEECASIGPLGKIITWDNGLKVNTERTDCQCFPAFRIDCPEHEKCYERCIGQTG
jgi:hypothetical protein